MTTDPQASVTFVGRLLREGGMAILVAVDSREEWIPRAQLLPGTTLQRQGDVGQVVIPRWLARNLGLA